VTGTGVLPALVLALRGAAAVAVLTTLAGGVPRAVQAALAAATGVWTALLVLPVRAIDPSLASAISELAIGGAIGVAAAIPLLAAQTAGRLVDLASGQRGAGPYGVLFGVLAAAVFVGIDGHVRVIATIVESHQAIPTSGGAVAILGALVPLAVRLAIPWLVTAAIIEIAVGVGVRVAGRAGIHVPLGVAAPAALVMITASLVSLLAIAMSAAMRGAF
jgi:flagellar biosynthesis protein FliR